MSRSDLGGVGPYRLLAELGSGGMGRVLLGAAPDGRLVAVKQVHARFAADDGFRVRFRREVAASRKVSGAYTAAVIDADADAPTPWLASVFVAGPSLGAVVEAAGPLPEEAVRRLAAGLATALAEIHRAGLVHRDLKPDNVLLAEDGVRVIDFGIARAAEAGVDTRLTQTGLVVGSPAFMSPEQAEAKDLTPASDVFSLGSVLVLALTGSSPFAGASVMGTLFNLVHAEPDLTAVPPGLRELVARCLAKDPAARPSPAQLLALLGPVAPGGRLPWPSAVHGMLAAQQAGIDRLLGDRDRTVVGSPEPEPTAIPEPELVELAAERRPAALAPAPRRPNRPRWMALGLAGGLLASAGLGIWAFIWMQSAPDTKYTKLAACSQAAPQVSRLPAARDRSRDSYSADDVRTSASCGWSQGQTQYASVTWELELGEDRFRNGTEEQRKRYAAVEFDNVRESGIGDEAFWKGSCQLVVRDGNLMLEVWLDTRTYNPKACRTLVKDIARAAMAAVPSR